MSIFDHVLFGRRLRALREECARWEKRAREEKQRAREERDTTAQLIEIIRLYESEIIGISHGGQIWRMGPHLASLRKNGIIKDIVNGRIDQAVKGATLLEFKK